MFLPVGLEGLHEVKYERLARATAPQEGKIADAATADNADNLAPILAEMTRRYHGTALGRQELRGELPLPVSSAR